MPSRSVADLFQHIALTRYLFYFDFSASPSFVLPVQQASRGSYKMVSPYYTCVRPCKANWDKPGPFSRHQKTCKHWLAHEEKMQKRQREAAARPKKRVKLALNKVPFSLVIFFRQLIRLFDRKLTDWMRCQPQRTSSLPCRPQRTLRRISTCQGHIPSSLWTYSNLVRQVWQRSPQSMLIGVYRAC